MSGDASSEISVQRRNLSAVLGAEDDEDAEVLGRAMVYRAGEVLVPRDWLMQRCRDLDVPERIIPSQTTPHSAYKRSQARLVTSNVQNGGKRTDRRFVKFDGIERDLKVTLDLKDGSGNVNHLTADVFFPATLTGEEGGKWVHHDMGHFNYDKDTQAPVAVKADDIPEALEALWDEMQVRAKDLHDRMLESHTGDDLRHMVYLNMILNSPPQWPNVIPLIDRGGLYFVPEGPLTDVIESMATIFREASENFKVGGAEMAIRTLEVVDSDDKREWIRQRVEQSLEEMVDDVIDEAFAALEDGEDTADEIVSSVVDRLDAEGHSAEQYNNLLQAKLDVGAYLHNRAKQSSNPDKREIIERAMDGADL